MPGIKPGIFCTASRCFDSERQLLHARIAGGQRCPLHPCSACLARTNARGWHLEGTEGQGMAHQACLQPFLPHNQSQESPFTCGSLPLLLLIMMIITVSFQAVNQKYGVLYFSSLGMVEPRQGETQKFSAIPMKNGLDKSKLSPVSFLLSLFFSFLK